MNIRLRAVFQKNPFLVITPQVVVGPTDFGREGKGQAGGDPSFKTAKAISIARG